MEVQEADCIKEEAILFPLTSIWSLVGDIPVAGSGFHLGSMSKTHPGDLDFTTKKGDECFVRKGHRICIPHTLPFIKKP